MVRRSHLGEYMSSAAPMISVQNVWKVFGNNPEKVIGSADANLSRTDLRAKTGNTIAVRDVSFDVAPGEVFVVMGLSGSGKSTLLKCLNQTLRGPRLVAVLKIGASAAIFPITVTGWLWPLGTISFGRHSIL